jgi:hypothetical protein
MDLRIRDVSLKILKILLRLTGVVVHLRHQFNGAEADYGSTGLGSVGFAFTLHPWFEEVDVEFLVPLVKPLEVGLAQYIQHLVLGKPLQFPADIVEGFA